ncbi:MAG: hypothetical protein M5U01_17205 [Ardenticatenaceae bacterium]|nr:hypothetical protein [Ardenticatenaceae bacterium]
MPVEVCCRSGARFGESPTSLCLDGQWVPVSEVIRAWHEPTGLGFVVRLADGRVGRLAYERLTDQWHLVQFSLPGLAPRVPEGGNE